MTNYALIHNRIAGQTCRVPLPAIVGSNEQCDVIINAEAIADFAYEMHSNGKLIELRKHRDGQIVDLEALGRFGLQIEGPLAAKDSTLTPQSKWRERLAGEAMWFDRLPHAVGLVTGAFLPQKFRYLTWAASAALLVLLSTATEQPIVQDLSQKPIALALDEVSSTIIGHTIKRRGHEKGGTLAVVIDDKGANLDHLISFQAAKLDVGGEVKFVVGDKTLFASSPMPNCLKKFCPVSFRVPAGILQKGSNLIRIVHEESAGFYIIGQLLIRPLPEITEQEINRVERWEATANRAYNERDIVPKNLVDARRDLDQALDFMNRRAGADQLRARLEAFRAEAEEAFAKEVSDRWARVEVNFKLKKYDVAEYHLGTLMDLHPDTSSPEHRNVQRRLNKLKEMKQ